MEETIYRYALDIMAEGGAPLGQVPIEPDWEPALEWASFQGIRRGLLAARMGSYPGIIRPIWDGERGEPYVAGFRAVIPGEDDGAVTSDFPTSYVRHLARQASTTFVDKGLLKPGDLFRFRVCAFGSPPAPARQAASGGLEVEEIPCSLPVASTPLSTFLEGSVPDGPAAVAEDFPVFLPQHVLDEMASLCREAPDLEIGGVLVGKLHRDPETGEVFLEVTAQIPARHTLCEATKLEFTAETWAAVDVAISLRRQDDVKIGWWHQHPNWCRNCPPEKRRNCVGSSAFMSAEDLHLHRVCFGSAYHVALLMSNNSTIGLGWYLFGWRQGVVVSRGFNIIGGRLARHEERVVDGRAVGEQRSAANNGHGAASERQLAVSEANSTACKGE